MKLSRVLTFLVAGCLPILTYSQTFYIVRHAEKAQGSTGATMNTTADPPLTRAGELRAEALRNILKDKHIHHIFSTNTKRTLSTAQPLSHAIGVEPEIYSSADDDFITRLKKLDRNVLVVAHSNTVDDIVNSLSGDVKVSGDLPDSEYDNLYVVAYKKKKVLFAAKKYGRLSN